MQKKDPEGGRNLAQEVKVLLCDLEVLPSLRDKGAMGAGRAQERVVGGVWVPETPAGLAATTRGSRRTRDSPLQLLSET